MTVLDKTTLSSGVSSTFIDNVAGSITPTTVRSQQNDMIDSLLSQLVPGTGSAAGSLLHWVTSSTTNQLVLGTVGSILQAGASAPSWLALGSLGSILQAGASVPSWLALGTAGSILQAGASVPNWLAPGSSGSILQPVSGSNAWTTSARLGVPGSTQGTLTIAGATAPSAVTLGANNNGASISFVFPASMGTSGFLLRTDGSANTSWVNGAQIPGDTTGASASAGNIGEFQVSNIVVGSAVALSNNAASNVTSLNLTAGDWDLWGSVAFTNSASVPITQYIGVLNGTSATIPNAPGSGAMAQYLFSTALSQGWVFPVGSARFSVSTTTAVFLVALASFASGSTSAYGILEARRRR